MPQTSESHTVRSSTIIMVLVPALTSLRDPSTAAHFSFQDSSADCGEQMGLCSLCCNTVDHIRAIKQCIKNPSLWSYRTCHWSISGYICQAMRILIARLILASDWCDSRIYGSCEYWGRADKCDTAAYIYSRLMAHPGGLVSYSACYVFDHCAVIEADRTTPFKHCVILNTGLWKRSHTWSDKSTVALK